MQSTFAHSSGSHALSHHAFEHRGSVVRLVYLESLVGGQGTMVLVMCQGQHWEKRYHVKELSVTKAETTETCTFWADHKTMHGCDVEADDRSSQTP
eukprot:6478963-Amphidinium_carterae.2